MFECAISHKKYPLSSNHNVTYCLTIGLLISVLECDSAHTVFGILCYEPWDAPEHCCLDQSTCVLLPHGKEKEEQRGLSLTSVALTFILSVSKSQCH